MSSIAVSRMGGVYLAKDQEAQPSQCHYADRITGNNRCAKRPEPGRAYCKEHAGYMPSGPGLASSLGGAGGNMSISKSPNGIGNK